MYLPLILSQRLAIAAHELGHAMQDKEDYFPLRLRSAMVPAVNIGSYLGWILIVIGMLLQATQISWLGVLVFSGGATFCPGYSPRGAKCFGSRPAAAQRNRADRW